MMRKLKTPQSAVLFIAQRGAMFVPVPGLGQGISAVGHMLADETFSARATALLLLCQDPRKRSKECVSMLDRSFVDEEWSVRAAGLQLVAASRDRLRRGKVAGLFGDKSEKVRYRAAATYLRVEGVR